MPTAPLLPHLRTRIYTSTQTHLHNLAFFFLRKDKYKSCLYTLRIAHYLHTRFQQFPPSSPPPSSTHAHAQQYDTVYDTAYFHTLDLLALKHLLYSNSTTAYDLFLISLRGKEKHLHKGEWELVRSRIRIARAVAGMEMWDEAIGWYQDVLEEVDAGRVKEGEGVDEQEARRVEMDREIEGVREELEGCLEMVGKGGMGEGVV
ncbi:hypothetical protein FB567DRAFT_584670 [Paraphoma chrysanthemicola]|uniref:Uncharacterized protein n=1 Tax=Paraphoma chrysanthemicola TaxID=798071 RepID=A0A8K0VT20_9PLEO|nr:hypothetical protein FB567DRAFT_584670 [Paraphoma chrysanthemicola]